MNGITAALTGRLGGDAELKYTAAGSVMAVFSVAIDDAKRGDGEPTEWIRCTVWGEQADELAPRLVKGTSVYVEGRLRLETWTGQDGHPRSGLKLSAWTCQPLGQIGRRAPRRRNGDGEPVRLGAGSASRRMPASMAVGGGRNTRQALGLDDDLSGWPD